MSDPNDPESLQNDLSNAIDSPTIQLEGPRIRRASIHDTFLNLTPKPLKKRAFSESSNYSLSREDSLQETSSSVGATSPISTSVTPKKNRSLLSSQSTIRKKNTEANSGEVDLWTMLRESPVPRASKSPPLKSRRNETAPEKYLEFLDEITLPNEIFHASLYPLEFSVVRFDFPYLIL